jgi:hypothetical protein
VKRGESINRYLIKERGIQKHGETARRISFMFWLKNYWVKGRGKGTYKHQINWKQHIQTIGSDRS